MIGLGVMSKYLGVFGIIIIAKVITVLFQR
jgi:hypothetical protein